eukprot:2834156-Alexandrium_andersonii.AAC.1
MAAAAVAAGRAEQLQAEGAEPGEAGFRLEDCFPETIEPAAAEAPGPNSEDILAASREFVSRGG